MEPAGGIERVISKHINYLSNNQHQIILLTKDNNSSFYKLPSTVICKSINIDFKLNMNSRISRIFKICKRFILTKNQLSLQLKIIQPDIIYVATPLNLLELFLTNFDFKKVIVTEHSSYSSYNSIYKLLAKFLYKKVKVLTVPTKLDSLFYSSLNINNIYLPNPLTFYPPYSSSLESKTVLNVGRLTDDKRHQLLIKIWSMSNAQKYNWKLKIVGKGENYEKISNLINDLNLNETVILSPVTSNIINEFESCSIFALTSKAEGFGLVLAESMSLGVPCISFNCPSGPRDIISNNINGFLIENDDINEYVQKLNLLMEDVDLRKKMGKNAKVDILKFSEDKISKELNNIITNSF